MVRGSVYRIFRLLSSAILFLAVSAADYAVAEQTAAGRNARALAEFRSSVKAFGKAKDPEKVILWGERALKAAEVVVEWPAGAAAGARIAMSLRYYVAEEYIKRKKGVVAQNRERAIVLLEAAIANDNDDPEVDRELRAKAYANLGAGYVARRNIDWEPRRQRAISVLQTALELAQRLEDNDLIAAAKFNLACAYFYKMDGPEDFELARPLFEDYLGTDVKKDPLGLATALSALGEIYYQRAMRGAPHNLERSLIFFNRAIGLIDIKFNRKPWFWARYRLGGIYRMRPEGGFDHNMPISIELLQNALRAADKKKDHDLWRLILTELAQTLTKVAMSRPGGIATTEALDHYSKLLADLPSDAEPYERAKFYLEVAQLNLHGKPPNLTLNNSIASAIASFEKVLAVLPEQDRSDEKISALTGLARANLDLPTGDRRVNLAKAGEYLNEISRLYSNEDPPNNIVTREFSKGIAKLIAYDYDAASIAFETMTTAIYADYGSVRTGMKAADLVEAVKDRFLWATYAAAKSGKFARAFELADQARNRELAISIGLESLTLSGEDKVEIAKLRSEIKMHEDLLRAADYPILNENGPLNAGYRELVLADLSRDRTALQEIVDRAGGVNSFKRPEPVEVLLLVALSQFDVVALPIVTEAGSCILFAKRGAGTTLDFFLTDLKRADSNSLLWLTGGRPDGSESYAWTAVVNTLRDANTLRRPETAKAMEAFSQQLWSLIGEEFDAGLRKLGLGKNARVLWIPQGPIGAFPISVARPSENAAPLLEMYQISVAPSLTTIAWIARRNSSEVAAPKLMAVVNPSNDTSLTFADIEGALIASHFTEANRVMVAAGGRLQDVFSAMAVTSYWHFATHGTYDSQQTSKSSLMLDGSSLAVDDLTRHSFTGRARLVVLSACETGLHDLRNAPEEFVGFPLAFLEAGAQAVVASLWRISDLSTTILMSRFYDFHLGDGLAPGQSLRQAQLWLRSATRQDLQNYVSAKISSGKVAADVAAVAKAEFELGDRQEKPYASSLYWASFVIVGL
jgi:CHAT domain-containing protein/tetratricopeptide (TPR) repeat protein